MIFDNQITYTLFPFGLTSLLSYLVACKENVKIKTKIPYFDYNRKDKNRRSSLIKKEDMFSYKDISTFERSLASSLIAYPSFMVLFLIKYYFVDRAY